MNLIVLSRAELELSEGVDYYMLEESPQSARRFVEAVDKAVAEILRAPFLLKVEEGNIRKKFVKRFPYAVIYTVEDEDVIVHAIMHQSRLPDYWRYRL